MPADMVARPRWGTTPWRAAVGERDAVGHGQVVLSGPDERALVVWSGEPDGQPTWATDGRAAVVLDGVLYRRGELAERLGLGDGPDRSDATLALAAWRHWGEDCAGHLRGVFGLLIWDAERDGLLLVRDAMGMYPLYYARAGRVTVASTWLEPVVAHPAVPGTLNRAMLAEHLALRWSVVDETFYQAVYRVPPGHAVRLAGGDRRLFQHWDPTPTDDADWLRGDPLPAFEAALERAVARATAYGPPGIFLSGGLDSVSVAAVATDMARRSGGPAPLALSLAFPGPEDNEVTVQRGVAAALGLEQILLTLAEAAGPTGLLAGAVARSAVWSQPMSNLWLPAYETLARAGVARGVRGVLTGGGGDDWLTVNSAWLGDLLRAGDLLGAVRLVRSFTRSYNLPAVAMLRTNVWRFGLRPLVVAQAIAAGERVAPARLNAWRMARHRASRPLPAWVAPDPDLRRALDERLDSMTTTELATRGVDGGRRLYLSTSVSKSFFRPFMSMELEEFAEFGRRLGIPVQAVYQDAELAELLMRVPPEHLLRGGREKGLVRTALALRFPELGFGVQRKVLSVQTYTDIVTNDSAAVWSRMGGLRVLRALGLVSPRLTADPKSDILYAHEAARAGLVASVLCLEAWVRTHPG